MPTHMSISDDLCRGERRRCYLTRSAKVTGLLGRTASLLISSSGICAKEGGCDQVDIAGGNVAAEVYHRALFGPRRSRGLQALAKSSAIAHQNGDQVDGLPAARDTL